MSKVSEMIQENSVCMQSVDMDLTCLPPGNTSLQQTDAPSAAEQQTMSVYLRVRPFSKEELSNNEDQACVVIENSQTVTLNAPKGSATIKSREKGIGMSLHKFYFSQIFGPDTTQAELFENTVKSQMSDFLDGKNALIFSYGVTNAGKTFTIQGSPKEPGILPRVLESTFQYIGEHQYPGMDLKPYLRNGVQSLDFHQVKQERITKAAIFASFKEECDSLRGSGCLESCSPSRLSSSSASSTQTVLTSNQAEANDSQFALWVAFFEIYNEYVYDLLQPSLCSKSKKRACLRVCDDGAGNAYVKDLIWINIHNLGEASKLLHFGNKNRSAAATKMNHSSSRSHSIFTMKILRINGGTAERVSEFSLCDLAGSERCNKTKTFGERLKEAGNINNSLLILGKCITALRNSGPDRTRSIPFRESKLTKLFQAFFCGKGRPSMIVNINQCASTYDETLHVMKFSAVAKQVVQVIPDKALESLAPRLVGHDGKPLLSNGVFDSNVLESYLSEDELLDEEEEADMSLLPQSELLNVVENLRTKLLAERRKNLLQEIEIRKEMGDAMLQQLMESEELRNRQIEELKESYRDKLENTFEMYKDAIKEHAYHSAMTNLEDNYVPLDEFTAEQEKVEALRRKVSELEALTSRTGVVPAAPTVDQSSQTEPLSIWAGEAGDDRYRCLHREKCAIERMCEDKQQLILSLEKRLMELNETLQKVRDGFMEKSADLEALQRTADDQKKSMEEILQQNVEKDKEIVSLKAEVAKLSQKSPVQAKTKRGLLANIREAVTSPRKGTSARTLRKTGKTVHH
ncbi:kinesin-like protein KIF20A isoform X1 [Pundamilia nyererei]|uniref:Kinesin-like protein n=2 Tax=Pundamilia nyererei TaxID=303518 RepID=A0A9Y3RTR0_9CICH|nr:PREDICTED: kinesin-like protein KIF20A isoform X1 [Pundamilia nyererei]XP_005744922.1 PREDICTED: kinesin-like protein KIF20A isoform X1 [Pundamilia nyererei]